MQESKAEKPILFSGPMVRAILEGRKTQTRRVINPQPAAVDDLNEPHTAYQGIGEVEWFGWIAPNTYKAIKCPYGKVGSRLWVRETWRSYDIDGTVEGAKQSLRYRADGEQAMITWKPSIFMPRWASRITLEITEIRVERLQDITEEDAIAEGLQRSERTGFYASPSGNCDYATWAYRYLWDSINAKRGYSWESNCWVWVLTFKRVT